MLQRAECGVQKVQTSMAAVVPTSYCCVTQSYQQQTSCQVIRMVSHHNYEQRTHKTSNMKDSLYLCKNGSAEHQHGVTFALPSRFAAGGSCRNDTNTSKHVIPCFCSCKRVISPHDVTPSRQLTNVWALLVSSPLPPLHLQSHTQDFQQKRAGALQHCISNGRECGLCCTKDCHGCNLDTCLLDCMQAYAAWKVHPQESNVLQCAVGTEMQ